MSDATDERRARALFRRDKTLYEFPKRLTWQKISEGERELYRREAMAVRKSDEAAGLVLVYKDALEILKRDAAAKGAGDE